MMRFRIESSIAATRLATVGGVAKVDNELKVDKDVDRTLGERARSGLTKTGEAITDACIETSQVKDHPLRSTRWRNTDGRPS